MLQIQPFNSTTGSTTTLMANFIAKASQPGYDARTAIERNLAFDVAKRHLMIKDMGVANTTTFSLDHNLGYTPGFDGYIKQTDKYFLNYVNAPNVTFGFENSLYGNITTDATKIYANCATANKLVYLLYDNAIYPTDGNHTSRSGFTFLFSQPGYDVRTCGEGRIGFAADLTCPLIITSGIATVEVKAITATIGTTQEETDFVDVFHGQPQANHVISPDFYGFSTFGLYPEPIGLVPPFVTEDYEAFIDATKIRFRVSRQANASATLQASDPAKQVAFQWILTNVPLP